MALFNPTQRELTIKLVYYGPALSGKTTNLKFIHSALNPAARGRLMTLNTADDRTLFFDMMPVFLSTKAGFRIKIKLFTVPGQVMHSATRRIVLKGADGIIFVADSRRSQAQANADAWRSMRENLSQNAVESSLPIVVQFNKRDLKDVRTDEELNALQKGKEPIFKAKALQGEGVLEPFFWVLWKAFLHLERIYSLQSTFAVSGTDVVRTIYQQLQPADRARVNLDAIFEKSSEWEVTDGS